VNRYAKYEGGREDRAPRGDRRERPPRRDRPPREGGRGGERGPRPGGERGAGRGPAAGPLRAERPEPPVPLPGLEVGIVPEEKGVESIARQIKFTGRAYPLFEIAALVLKKPERYHFIFSVNPKPDGAVPQPLFVCNLDDTLWLSEAEAVSHVIGKHFNTF